MNALAEGAQYRVFDTHDGRVRKVPITRQESQAIVQSWYAPDEAPHEALAIDYRKLALDSCRQVEALLHKYPQLRTSFGNPMFEGEGAYTQDKMPTLGEVLQKSLPAEGEKLINAFIKLVLHHWRYGLSEQVFNWSINNGVAPDGRVVLLDFGEITTDRMRVQAGITSQKWLRTLSYRRDLPKNLKDHYHSTLAARFTPQALEATWGIALKD